MTYKKKIKVSNKIVFLFLITLFLFFCSAFCKVHATYDEFSESSDNDTSCLSICRQVTESALQEVKSACSNENWQTYQIIIWIIGIIGFVYTVWNLYINEVPWLMEGLRFDQGAAGLRIRRAEALEKIRAEALKRIREAGAEGEKKRESLSRSEMSKLKSSKIVSGGLLASLDENPDGDNSTHLGGDSLDDTKESSDKS